MNTTPRADALRVLATVERYAFPVIHIEGGPDFVTRGLKRCDSGRWVQFCDVEAALAALATPPADARADWLLVPREPTDEMLEAYHAADRTRAPGRNTWAAMLVAAPPAAPATSGEGREGWTARWHKEGDDSLILLSHPTIGSVGVYKEPCEPGRPMLEAMLYDFGLLLLATPSPSDAADNGDDLPVCGWPTCRCVITLSKCPRKVEMMRRDIDAARAADNGERA